MPWRYTLPGHMPGDFSVEKPYRIRGCLMPEVRIDAMDVLFALMMMRRGGRRICQGDEEMKRRMKRREEIEMRDHLERLRDWHHDFAFAIHCFYRLFVFTTCFDIWNYLKAWRCRRDG